jgi:hypothetical protein
MELKSFVKLALNEIMDAIEETIVDRKTIKSTATLTQKFTRQMRWK